MCVHRVHTELLSSFKRFYERTLRLNLKETRMILLLLLRWWHCFPSSHFLTTVQEKTISLIIQIEIILLVLYLVHKSACMKAQAVEEHFFAEDVHFFNSDEQWGHTGPNDGAGQRSNMWTSQSGLHLGITYIINYVFISSHQKIVKSTKCLNTANKCSSQVPRAQSDIFKLLALSRWQCKTKKVFNLQWYKTEKSSKFPN